jgi:hypothetical protein
MTKHATCHLDQQHFALWRRQSAQPALLASAPAPQLLLLLHEALMLL